MEDDDFIIKKQLTLEALQECDDPELVDLIYKMIEYHRKEQQINVKKGFKFMEEKNKELKDIKDNLIKVVENIDDPDVLELILTIFRLRKKIEQKNEDGKA